ncbi:hypothetical protein DFH09DRAFT_1285794 [Mycena vulgaris]|nr:hypothetical protein DFH09DRAFT_1285794 [Mycena vulgaris]
MHRESPPYRYAGVLVHPPTAGRWEGPGRWAVIEGWRGKRAREVEAGCIALRRGFHHPRGGRDSGAGLRACMRPPSFAGGGRRKGEIRPIRSSHGRQVAIARSDEAAGIVRVRGLPSCSRVAAERTMRRGFQRWAGRGERMYWIPHLPVYCASSGGEDPLWGRVSGWRGEKG